MTTATEDETMSKPLSAAAVSTILSHGKWLGSEKVRITCTHRTAPVLRKAGIYDPTPFEEYDLPVKRDGKGLLVLDRAPHAAPPVGASDESLFEAGGIFAGGAEPVNVINLQTAIATNRPKIEAALAPEMDALCEMTRTRTFEVTTHSHQKIRVQVIAFDDESLPSPGERERWTPAKPSNVQIHAAISALYMARHLSHFEQV